MGHDGRNLPDTSAGPGDVRGYGLPLVRNTPGYADIPFIGKRTHRSRCLLAVCHRLDRRSPLLLARGSRNQGQDLGRNRKMVADSKKAKGLRPRNQKLFQSSSTTPRFDTTEVDCHKSSTASAVLGVQRSRKEISAGEPAGGSKNSVLGFVGDDISDGRAIDGKAEMLCKAIQSHAHVAHASCRSTPAVCWAPTIFSLAQADWPGNFLAVHCSKLVFLVFVDSSKKNIFHTVRAALTNLI